MKFVRHGRGAGNGEWVPDATVSQAHAGQHMVRNGRWSRWENDIDTIKPSKNYPNFNVTVVSKLEGKEVGRTVAKFLGKDADKPMSGISSFDATMSAPHPNFNFGH